MTSRWWSPGPTSGGAATSRPGRARSSRPPPELGLPVSTRPEDAAEVGAELGVVVAFGRIIKKDVLDRLPLVNAHFSLLPRWRGRGAGRAGHPGRRPRDRRLPDGDRRGSRHRPGIRLRGGGHRRRRDGGRAAVAPGGAGRGHDWSTCWRPGPGPRSRKRGRRPTPTRSRPPTCGWTGQPTPSSCTGWCGWGGPGRPGGATGCWCWPGASPTGPPATDRPAASRATWWRPGAGGLRLLTVQPEGRAPMAVADWLRGARPGPASCSDREPGGDRRRAVRPRPAGLSRPVVARRLAVDALIAVDGGARANAVVPELLGASRARRQGPGAGHRAGVRRLPDAAGV